MKTIKWLVYRFEGVDKVENLKQTVVKTYMATGARRGDARAVVESEFLKDFEKPLGLTYEERLHSEPVTILGGSEKEIKDWRWERSTNMHNLKHRLFTDKSGNRYEIIQVLTGEGEEKYLKNGKALAIPALIAELEADGYPCTGWETTSRSWFVCPSERGQLTVRYAENKTELLGFKELHFKPATA